MILAGFTLTSFAALGVAATTNVDTGFELPELKDVPSECQEQCKAKGALEDRSKDCRTFQGVCIDNMCKVRTSYRAPLTLPEPGDARPLH